jgi:hypothetical protein
MECHATLVSAKDRDVDGLGGVHGLDSPGSPPATGSRDTPQGRQGHQTVHCGRQVLTI